VICRRGRDLDEGNAHPDGIGAKLDEVRLELRLPVPVPALEPCTASRVPSHRGWHAMRTRTAAAPTPEPADPRRTRMAYEQLIADLDGGVATVRLNYPDKLNALSTTLSNELVECMTQLRDDSSVRAIVLTGEGRGFCVGADLTSLQEPYLKGE